MPRRLPRRPALASGELIVAQRPGPNRKLLSAEFRAIGLEAGDSVIVHSSMRKLGTVEGGADTVIDALLDAIGPGGNLMLPTFNYTGALPEPYYDLAGTPCRTGIIPETGRKRRDAVRSLHPTHSVAVIGPDAEELTRDHLKYRAFGIGSPIDRLLQRGGKVLLIGVDNRSNSAVHVAEEYAKIPKPSPDDTLPFIKILTPDGDVVSHQLDTSPSCSLGFNGVEWALRRHGEIRDYRIGGALCHLMRGADVVKRACELIAEKADILLCTSPTCAKCMATREALRAEGRS